MPRFKVWFKTSFPPGYYRLIECSQDADALHERWKDDPYLIGISKMDDSDLPPAIQEKMESNANHV